MVIYVGLNRDHVSVYEMQLNLNNFSVLSALYVDTPDFYSEIFPLSAAVSCLHFWPWSIRAVRK